MWPMRQQLSGGGCGQTQEDPSFRWLPSTRSSSMQLEQGGARPLFQLGAAVSKLLGRALGACLATGAPPSDHTVSLELLQSSSQPGLLGLRGEARLLAMWRSHPELPGAQESIWRDQFPARLPQCATTACRCRRTKRHWSAAAPPLWRAWHRCWPALHFWTAPCWCRPQVGARGCELQGDDSGAAAHSRCALLQALRSTARQPTACSQCCHGGLSRCHRPGRSGGAAIQPAGCARRQPSSGASGGRRQAARERPGRDRD